MTIIEAGAALRSRKISCRELTEDALRAAARENPRLNAFMIITDDTARARAAELDDLLARGVDLGPLHGIPIAHKDCLFTNGVRTTWGSKLFADFVPDVDADVAGVSLAAGADVEEYSRECRSVGHPYLLLYRCFNSLVAVPWTVQAVCAAV